MLTLNEFIELREKLINNEVRAEFVKKKLELHWDKLKEGKRSWHTKDWKERRDKFLKEKCEVCSSTDTLTIQREHSFYRYYFRCSYKVALSCLLKITFALCIHLFCKLWVTIT